MGFKRTSEGRVFFQTGDNSSGNELSDHLPRFEEPSVPANNRQPLSENNSRGEQYTQIQILGLLKGLNEKLKSTQTERNQMRQELERYRQIIEDLEEKSERQEQVTRKLMQQTSQGNIGTSPAADGRAVQAEKIARETLQELQETRKLLFDLESKAEQNDKTLSALKSIQQDQAQKMARTVAGYSQLTKRLQENEERQHDIGGRLEEAISQQARLVRKIDKSIEDRARFMRKIERIEETVIQTRDALNAKAMVLLTDQGAATRVGFEDQNSAKKEEPVVLNENGEVPQALAFWQKPIYRQVTGALTIAFACVLLGWGMSKWLNTREQPSAITPPPPAQDEIADSEENQTAEENTATQTTQSDTVLNTSEETLFEPAPIDVGAADDIGTLDVQSDEELQKMLESNPDQVAATMNAIEPGSNQTLKFEDESMTTPQQPTTTQTPPPAPAFEISKPLAKGVPAQVKQDVNLPESIKQLEKQAMEGVPEAQHDLAAVYTAGHAGVKQDYGRAAYWFKKAADNGIANAAYNLGVLNHQGLGINANLEEAIRWYKVAADRGHPEAQYNLGIAFIEGIGVPYNPSVASQYFKDAAGKGIKEAAYNLGLIYENGLLGKPQPDEAVAWYKTAADAGSPEAKAALEQLAKSLGIKVEDINRVADKVKSSETPAPSKSEAAKPKSTKPPAPEPEKQSQVTPKSSASPVQQKLQQNTQLSTIMSIQEYLMKLGLFPGPADGLNSPVMGDAIRSYQSLNKLTIDGKPSASLLEHMLKNAPPLNSTN